MLSADARALADHARRQAVGRRVPEVLDDVVRQFRAAVLHQVDAAVIADAAVVANAAVVADAGDVLDRRRS